MKKFLFGIFFLVFNFSFSQSGEELHALEKKYDINYRVNYFNKMIFKIDVNSNTDNFFIQKINYSDIEKSKFIPNDPLNLRFSFDYKFLGLYYSISSNFIPGNNRNPNDQATKTQDFSFKFFYSDRLRQEVIFKKTRGYNLLNSNGMNLEKKFKNVEINRFGGKIFYIMNNNFSYRAYESMTERQIKSAGSFIPSFAYYYTVFSNENQFNNSLYLTSIYSHSFYFKIGYMYNLVLNKKWYSTLGANVGGRYLFSTKNYDNSQDNISFQDKKTNINTSIDLNLGIGYNNKNMFLGIKSNYKNINYSKKMNSEIFNSNLAIEFFMGYRFDEVKPIKSIFEKIEKFFLKKFKH
jgi:hypothetical protein